MCCLMISTQQIDWLCALVKCGGKGRLSEPSNEKGSFLRDYVKLSEDTEIPDMFALWCGLCGVSCTLGRRVWLDMGTYTIFPNLFVVLVAGSGRCRKSTAVSQVEGLLRKLNPKPNLIAQRITPEGLIDALQVVHTTDKKQFLKKTSEGFIVVDELSTFLNRKTYESGLASLLIPLYDCKASFEYRTKGRGTEAIRDSCLGLLGASTVDWIRSAIPIDAIGGGLTSRIIFVYVQHPPPPVAITGYSDLKKQIKEKLQRFLEEMSTVSGEMQMEPDAWEYYKTSYDTYYKTSPFFEQHTLSGYASRRHVHMLKLGILFSASEGNSRLILKRHLAGAEELLRQSELHMSRVLALISSTDKGALTEIIFEKIVAREGMDRTTLMRAMSHRLDSNELSGVIETLIHSGRIQARHENGKLWYVPLGG